VSSPELEPVVEALPSAHRWLRIADDDWDDPLDPTYAAEHGGRWNPPDSFPTLYVNRDLATARAQIVRMLAGSPIRPEDLDRGFSLLEVGLPDRQRVADAHTDDGLVALGLPKSYPRSRGREVPRSKCQPIGAAVKERGLRGVDARSAATPDGSGRELAWFPARASSRATAVRTWTFHQWWFADALR
jgi:RES domain-containing protein